MDRIDVYPDTSVIVDNISEHSDDDVIYDVNYEQITRHCGNGLDYDIYMAPNRDVTCHELLCLIIDRVVARGDSFRNLVLRLTTGVRYRHVSITKARIGNYCIKNNVSTGQALETIINTIDQGNMADIYEDYDENSVSYMYDSTGTGDNDFHIDTSYFAVTWVRSLSGSGIVEYASLKYINVINPPIKYGAGNCLFDCLDWCLSINIHSIDSMREVLRYKSSTKPIKLKHLRHIARMLKCRIVVYEDKIINDSIVFMSVGEEGATARLVLNNRHYSVFDGSKSISHNKDEQTKGALHIFYDLETYFDACNHKLVPYAMSYYIYETGVVDKCGCVIKTSTNDDISDKIYDVFKDYVELKGTTVIGYNNGAFDDYVLLSILCKHGDRLDKTLIDRYNRILTFKYGYMISKDLYRLLNTSLATACKSFGCLNIKGIIDHQEIQNHVDNGSFDSYMSQSIIETIRKYSIADVVSLKELYFKVVSSFSKIPNISDPTSCVTISQLSYKSYKTHISSISQHVLHVPPTMDAECDAIVRRALIGGRCDVFAKGEFHNVSMLDVCSLYPYIMMSNLYPYHAVTKAIHQKTTFTDMRRVRQYMPEYCGIYHVTITSQPHDNIVPYKCPNSGTYDWHSNTVIDRWVTNVVIDMLNENGCKYTISDGYILFCKSSNIFSSFLKPIMSMKRKQDALKLTGDISYNPALRECLKLIMNSLSGKMCQMPIECVKTLTNTISGCNTMLETFHDTISTILVQDHLWLMEGTIKQPKIKSPTIVACLIYDYAKKYMYDNLISKVAHKYYMDTDSMILSQNDLHVIDASLFGDEAGKLKHVLPVGDGPFHCIIGAKKCYCIYTIIDGEEVIYKDYFKLKGVNVERDRRIPHNKLTYIQDLIQADNRIALNDEYLLLPPIKSIDTIRTLSHNGWIYVLCYQITRTLSVTGDANQNMLINNRYLIKQLPLTYNNEL